jgi:dihydrofolate synthase/folylpolyglutamate synthase
MAVCGMLGDKDVAGVLAPLRSHVDRWFAATTDGARGLADAELAGRAAAVGLAMTPAGSVAESMRRAAVEAREGDRIVVFGSFHTVGPALSCV